MKKKRLVWGTVAGGVIIALALRRPAKASVPTSPIKVQGGLVTGTVEDGLNVFKGIPFAAPPTGPNRWRSPQPIVPWKGIKQADAFGPAPLQSKLAAMLMSQSFTVNMSEDCLYLNIWAPDKQDKQKQLPVMVWIYGGAFNSGLTNSPLYDGARLAKRGVVLVSIAYRVGPFGFLAHPGLSAESVAENRSYGSGNYGLMDQIAALRWVQQNIAQFGGDPSNVTLFGESAGGESTSILAASPLAKGLFQKVISESGSFFGPIRQGDEPIVGPNALADAEKKGTRFLERLKVKNISEARALSADAIQKEAATGFKSGPVLDDYVIRDDAYRLYQAGKFNDTPLLLGTNSNDGGMFTPPINTPAQFETLVRTALGDKADSILAAYPHTTAAQAAKSARQIVGDTVFAWGTWSWARLQNKHGKNPAYLYYFDYAPDTPDGANHAAEIPYVFGTKESQVNAEKKALSDKMQLYWTNFAKTGNPNGNELETWPTFSEPNAQVLKFGSNIGIGSVPNLKQFEVLDQYFVGLRASRSIPTK
ncbi:para-nitrobenzyl esterase [Abditibacteriota bacterium]|nr:para-nitrobenzyl esterase [Abditibacteriota bacterium]